METERKFLVKVLPNLVKEMFKELVQAYLCFNPEVRIRSMNNEKFYLAQKTEGDLTRGEIEPEIDATSFQILLNLAQGRIINKTRFYLPDNNGLVSELDIYHGELEGLITVETEFKSVDDANNFEIPAWYGKEITYDKRYKNKNLARCSEEELRSLLTESIGTARIRK